MNTFSKRKIDMFLENYEWSDSTGEERARDQVRPLVIKHVEGALETCPQMGLHLAPGQCFLDLLTSVCHVPGFTLRDFYELTFHCCNDPLCRACAVQTCQGVNWLWRRFWDLPGITEIRVGIWTQDIRVWTARATCPGCVDAPPGADSLRLTQTPPEKETPSLSWPNTDAKTRYRKGKSEQSPSASKCKMFKQNTALLKNQVH